MNIVLLNSIPKNNGFCGLEGNSAFCDGDCKTLEALLMAVGKTSRWEKVFGEEKHVKGFSFALHSTLFGRLF